MYNSRNIQYRRIRLLRHGSVYMYFGKDIHRFENDMLSFLGIKQETLEVKMRECSRFDERGRPKVYGYTLTKGKGKNARYVVYMPEFSNEKPRLMAALAHEMLHVAIFTLNDIGIDIDINSGKTERLNKYMGELITDAMETISEAKQQRISSTKEQMQLPF